MSEHWLPVMFRGQRVYAQVSSDATFKVNPGGLIDFVYNLGGKVYRSREESFQRIPEEAVVRALAKNIAPPKASAAPLPSRSGLEPNSRVLQKAKSGVVGPEARRANAIQLWTDGACSGNPGPAGLGVRKETPGQVEELSEYLGEATNNIAELTAILRALAMVEDPNVAVDVMTDSEYCIGLLALGWKPKSNQQLVADLKASFMRFTDIQLVKVKGHAGIFGNERADALAREAVSSRHTRRQREGV